MDLKQYIRRNYKMPNPLILKDLGASEELITYLKITPWNTNFNIIDLFCEDSGSEESIEVLYDKDLSFTANPMGVRGRDQSNSVKNEVFDNLKNGDKVWITVGATRVEATVTEGTSSDGYTVIREFNLKNTLYIKEAKVNWGSYSQDTWAVLEVLTAGQPGTYNVKIEKIVA